jgi:hypothetical protein
MWKQVLFQLNRVLGLKFGRNESKTSSENIIGQKSTPNQSKGFQTIQLQNFLLLFFFCDKPTKNILRAQNGMRIFLATIWISFMRFDSGFLFCFSRLESYMYIFKTKDTPQIYNNSIKCICKY